MAGASTAAADSGVRWHAAAIRLPANRATTGQNSAADAVSCTTASDCVTGGEYYAKGSYEYGWLASEKDGRWRSAVRISLPANASLNPATQVASVACWATGDCLAVGTYLDGAGAQSSAFVATQTHGRWARAIQPALPGNAAAPHYSGLNAVACDGPKDCSATGYYRVSATVQASMVVSETRGRWGHPAELKMPSNISSAGGAVTAGIACPKAGSCVIAGSYPAGTTDSDAMVVTESRGRWSRAADMRYPRGAVASPLAGFTGVGCNSASSCIAVGTYSPTDASTAFLAARYYGGRWHAAARIRVTGLPAAGGVPYEGFMGVSCSARRCLAVGSYLTKIETGIPVAVTESGGRWGRGSVVAEPAGAEPVQSQQSSAYAASCSRTACTVTGRYVTRSGGFEPMAATES